MELTGSNSFPGPKHVSIKLHNAVFDVEADRIVKVLDSNSYVVRFPTSITGDCLLLFLECKLLWVD